jgi:hypothetical protein
VSKAFETDLQAPNMANLVVVALLSFGVSGTLTITGLELEPTFIGEMKQAYEAETCANLSEFILGI